MEVRGCTRTWAALFCAARLEVDNSRLPPRFPSLPLSSPPLSPALVLIIPEPAMAGSMFWSCGLAELDVCRFSTLSDGWPACWTASKCSRRAVWRSMCQHHTDSSVATIKVFWLLTLICCIFLSFMISYNPHGNGFGSLPVLLPACFAVLAKEWAVVASFASTNQYSLYFISVFVLFPSPSIPR